MKNWSKVWITIACAVCLVTASVSATLAVLMVRTETVENTFTVGKIDLTLDESKVNTMGQFVDEDGNLIEVDENGNPLGEVPRVKSNQYKLFEKTEYTKDPVVHVGKDSEDCYVFVKVENGIADIEDKEATTIAEQIVANDWKSLGEGVYYKMYETIAENVDYPVFEKFTIGNVAMDQLMGYDGKGISITAYAVQSAGIADAYAAWDMVVPELVD